MMRVRGGEGVVVWRRAVGRTEEACGGRRGESVGR